MIAQRGRYDCLQVLVGGYGCSQADMVARRQIWLLAGRYDCSQVLVGGYGCSQADMVARRQI
jgi:hypothetical protein